MRPTFGERDCKTCGRPAGTPFRVYNDRGKVVEGCVDAIHTGHLIGESARWHNRPEAKKIRTNLRRMLTGK